LNASTLGGESQEDAPASAPQLSRATADVVHAVAATSDAFLLLCREHTSRRGAASEDVLLSVAFTVAVSSPTHRPSAARGAVAPTPHRLYRQGNPRRRWPGVAPCLTADAADSRSVVRSLRSLYCIRLRLILQRSADLSRGMTAVILLT